MTRRQSVGVALLLAAAPAMAAARETPEHVVRRFLADYAAMRLEAIVAQSAPDVVMAMPFAPGGAVQLQGRAAIAAYLGDVFGKYRSIGLRGVIVTPAQGGRDVVVEAVAEFTAHDNSRHSVGYVWIITVVDGRIAASRNYLTPLT